MGNERRSYKVGEKLRNLVSTEVIRLADPRMLRVSITGAWVSGDLREAKIFWSSVGEENKEMASKAFKEAAARIKKSVAENLGTRYIPNISYHFDDTLETMDKVDQLLKKIKDDPIP